MVKLHVKPSKAELQAAAMKAAEEVDKLDAAPITPVETPKEPEVTPPVEEVKEEVVEEAPVEEKKKEEIKEEVKEEKVVDYKKRYVESTRGAQALLEEKKEMDKAIDTASQLPTPTDEEMIAIYPDWDVMSDSEKRVATRTEMADRKFELLHKASSVSKSTTEWFNNVDKFIENPKTMINYPDLEGKQEDFKIYATKPNFKGSDFHLIVKSFLFDLEKEEAKKPKNTGEMFPKGTGGPATTDNPTNKITNEELTRIRESNFKMFKEKLKLIKQGKLEVEEIN